MEKKVVLAYAWGTPNAGDHALTLGAIELLLKIVEEKEIQIISRFSSSNDLKDPTKDIKQRYPFIEIIQSPFKYSRTTFLDRLFEKLYGIYLVCFILLAPKKMMRNTKNEAIKSMLNAKILLCNGGNLFYWNQHRRSLPRLLALVIPFVIAKKMEVPYGFLPQTLGPIENNFILNYMLKILNSAKFVLFRDDNSYKYMKSMITNKKTKTALCPDLAFVISDEYKDTRTIEQVDDMLEASGIDLDQPFLTVTLRASQLGDPEGLSGGKVDSKAIENVANYLKEMILPVAEKRSLNVLIVEQTDVDDETSRYFAKICEDNFKNNIGYISSRNPDLLSALYARSECLVGMRLHSLIFALRVNKPAFAVYLKQFGPKTPGIYKTLNLDKYCIDMEDTSVNHASEKLDEMLDNSSSIEEKLNVDLNVLIKREEDILKPYIS